MRLRTMLKLLSSVALTILAGCASTAPNATFSTPIAARSVVRGDDTVTVSVVPASGVTLADADRDRLRALISQKIQQRQAQSGPDGRPESYAIEVVMTEYDAGSAFGRAMLAGLGQIHVDGAVAMYELPGRLLVGQFTVEKTFAWGGLYGAATSIEDVEIGFADGVAAAVTSEPD